MESKKISVNNKNESKVVSIPKVIFDKESTTIVHKARDAGWTLAEEMEANKLTKIQLNLTNGWRITLEHPQRQAVMNRGGDPYPAVTL